MVLGDFFISFRDVGTTEDIDNVGNGVYHTIDGTPHGPFNDHCMVLCNKRADGYMGFQIGFSQTGSMKVRVLWARSWKSWKSVTLA